MSAGTDTNGQRFLHHAEAVLERLGAAESEMLSEGPQAIRQLRLGLIDDFDTDVAPALTLELARMLPNCSFEHYSRPSHEILQLLADRRIEAGFAPEPQLARRPADQGSRSLGSQKPHQASPVED